MEGASHDKKGLKKTGLLGAKTYHEQSALGTDNHFSGGDSLLLASTDASDHLTAHLQ